MIERKVSVRVTFGIGSDSLGSSLERHKSQVRDLSRDFDNLRNKGSGLLKDFGPDADTFHMMGSTFKLAGDPVATGMGRQKAAADSLNQSIQKLEASFKKQALTAGMSANQMRIWELEQKGASKATIDRLKGMAEAADFTQGRGFHGTHKQFWSPKRIFAGGGFAMLGLGAQAAGGGMIGQAISGASTGAGVAVAMGATRPQQMITGALVGAAIGGVFELIRAGLEEVMNPSAKFNAAMKEMADSIRTSDRALERMRRGELPGEGEFSLLPGATVARVSTAVAEAGGLDAPGAREAGLAAFRRERERLGTLGPVGERERPGEDLRATRALVSFLDMEELASTERLARTRSHDTELGIIDAILRSGRAPGLIEPEIPAARGSGGIESIGIELGRAILERGGPMEETARATTETATAVRGILSFMTGGGTTPAPAPGAT